MKNRLDKYFTPDYVVKKAVVLAKKYFPNATEVVEPAAGDGAFIEEIKGMGLPTRFYDIEPEHPEIIQQDFKELKLDYKPGRIFVSNVPFGNASSLFKRFVKGGCAMGDGCVYVGPASHWNAKWGWDKFDLRLVYSEHLGNVEYYTTEGNGESKKVNTCLNVYMKGKDDEGDDRMERLERDLKIGLSGTLWKFDDPDFRLVYWGNGSYGEYHKTEILSTYIGIKVLNEEVRNKTEIFCERFKNNHKEEIKKVSASTKKITIPFVKQKLAEWLYSTKMERLERDVEIKSIQRLNGDGRGKKLKTKPEYKSADLEYDYYLLKWGPSTNGYKVEDINKITFIGKYFEKKDIRHNYLLGFKVLNEEKRKDIEYFCKNFQRLYFDNLKSAGKSNNENIPNDFIKQKLAEWLYSTNMQRLDRDVEIKSVANNTSEEVIVMCNKEYDYFIKQYSTKSAGKMIESVELPCWCFKIKNEDVREDVLLYLKTFYKTYEKNIKSHTASGINIRKAFLKQKLAEWLYPTKMERLDRDVEIRSFTKNESEDNENDYFIAAWGDGTAGIMSINPQYRRSWAIKILNENIRSDIEVFSKSLREREFKNIKSISSTAGITKDWLKQKLVEWLYDRKPEIKVILKYKNGRYSERDGIREKDWRDYDYFIGANGDGVVGKITKEPKYFKSFGIKSNGHDLTEFLHNFKEKYFDEIKEHSTGAAQISKEWLKNKLVSVFKETPQFYNFSKKTKQVQSTHRSQPLF